MMFFFFVINHHLSEGVQVLCTTLVTFDGRPEANNSITQVYPTLFYLGQGMIAREEKRPATVIAIDMSHHAAYEFTTVFTF